MSENLNVRGFRFAFWEMVEHEQPVELPRRTFETQWEGPHISVTENESKQLEQAHEGITKL